jgi:hypothetical protein
MVVQNYYLVRDTKIGYHFYISIYLLQSNELLQYGTLPSSLYKVSKFKEAVHFTTLYDSSTFHTIRDTTNLYTERKQIRSHILLRTLISELN